MTRYLTMFLIAGVLVGCSDTDPIRSQFNKEAGSLISNMGWSTRHNIAVMSEEGYYGKALAQRFASDVPTMINFDLNSAKLDDGAKHALTLQANWIKEFPEMKFRVYGHTDLTGPAARNKALGMRRALAVVKFFEQHGISRNRLEAVISYGEERPLVKTDDPNRTNRRTVTVLTGFYPLHPRVIDGKYALTAYRKYSGNTEQ